MQEGTGFRPSLATRQLDVASWSAHIYPIIQLGRISFYTYGLTLGVAICVSAFCFSCYFRRHNLLVNMPAVIITLVSSGLLGSRLDAALFYSVGTGHQARVPAFGQRVLGGGYTYLGAVVAGLIAALIFTKVNGLPWRAFDSTFCIGIGSAIGRVGCFLAGDGDYGIPSSLPWAISFPHGRVPTAARVHPTMLYSSIWEFAIFTFLWHYSNPGRRPSVRSGTLFCLFLILSCGGRFLVEFLSNNSRFIIGLTEAQIVSLGMILFSLMLLTRIYRGAPTEEDRNESHSC